jgi:hypothetical protein
LVPVTMGWRENACEGEEGGREGGGREGGNGKERGRKREGIKKDKE